MIYDVRDFGAVGDGVTFDTVAVQAAIDSCSASSGGTVHFPQGCYLSGTIYLKSNVRFYFEPDAVLVAGTSKSDYPDAEAYDLPLGTGYFICGSNIVNVEFAGQGTIDGSGPEFWTDQVLSEVANLGPIRAPKLYRPRALMYLTQSSNVSMHDITIRNSPCFTVWLLGCDRVNIDRITIDNPLYGPNTDGLDIDCCSNVHISNCYISAGDDAIALKSDAKRLGYKKACEAVTVTNCTFRSRACGVRIGYEGDAPITDCCFNNIAIKDTGTGFSFVSILPEFEIPQPGQREFIQIEEGCQIERISISNITMDNVNVPFYMWLGSQVDRQHKGSISAVNLSNIIAKANGGSAITGMPDNPVSDILISNYQCIIAKPLLYKQPELPYTAGVWGPYGIPYGLYIREADRVHLKNVRITWSPEASDGWEGDVNRET